MEIQIVNGVIEPADGDSGESATVVVSQHVWADMVEENRQMQSQVRDLARELNVSQLAWIESVDLTHAWAKLHGLDSAYDLFCAQHRLGRRSPQEKVYHCGVDVVVHVDVASASTSPAAVRDGFERQKIVDAIRTLTAPELAAAIAQWSIRSVEPVT